MASEASCAWVDGDLVLNLRVLAGASVDEIGHDADPRQAPAAGRSYLRVKVAAPPVDGKANKRLRKILANCFGVARSQVMIEKGETRQFKQVRIVKPKVLPDFVNP